MQGAIRSAIGASALLMLAACASVPASPSADTNSPAAIEARLHDHVAILASDEFEGRRPGTEGERRTLRYLAETWQAAGLVSGTNDPANPWFAPVELDLRQPRSGMATFLAGNRRIEMPAGQIAIWTSGRRALIEDAPLVFVGRLGSSLDRAELAGRVAVMPWNHSERASQREALLDKGAAAVLAIVDDAEEFAEIAAIRSRGAYSLVGAGTEATLDGIVDAAAFAQLVGGDRYRSLLAAAEKPDFQPVPLSIETTLEANSNPGTVRTHNLIGRLPGRLPDAGAVLLLAHWDHFGVCGQDAGVDIVCNGAVDNASGLAVLTELASQLAAGPRLDRDIYFLATTAEEWGLLGAQAFTVEPPVPLNSVVAAFNFDSVGVAPAGSDLGIVGEGLTPIEADTRMVIERMGRAVAPGSFASRFVQRQDGWALLRNDVPALMVSSAFAEAAAMDRFTRTRYHRPGDELDMMELGGAAEDVLLQLELVRHFASVVKYPPLTE